MTCGRCGMGYDEKRTNAHISGACVVFDAIVTIIKAYLGVDRI